MGEKAARKIEKTKARERMRVGNEGKRKSE